MRAINEPVPGTGHCRVIPAKKGKQMSNRSRARVLAALVCGSLALAAVVGGFALLTEVNAAPRCICPQVYSPVICDNGKTYPNLCVANCKHATGCVPIPIIPPPL